jgi:beta-xylosidase
MTHARWLLLSALSCLLASPAFAQTTPATGPSAAASRPTTRQARPEPPRRIQHLSEIRMRDVCILPDPETRTYYMIGPGRNSVRAYTSKDLITWDGPQTIYRTPPDVWGDIPVNSIWAPEMQKYKGKYYLFLTFSTNTLLGEQWREWRPRVVRGSTVLHSDSPLGPFQSFQPRSTPPVDMITLDATLWVEDGKPYMVFAHEWVQIVNGGICMMPLKDDLSAADGEPVTLFKAAEAPWSHAGRRGEGEGGFGMNVTDGPYLYTSKSGKLFMIWSSFHKDVYTTGVAISDSGKLNGPWRQEPNALHYDGGHGMLFTTFEGKLMMVLHSPNNRPGVTRPRIFELTDTGETLKVNAEFTGH